MPAAIGNRKPSMTSAGSSSLFTPTGRMSWQGEGILKLVRAAEAHHGVRSILLQRRTIRSVQDDEARIKIEFGDGWHGYANFFSYDNARVWAYTKASDKRSPFFGATVKELNV